MKTISLNDLGVDPESVKDRFMKRVDCHAPGGCWVWTGAMLVPFKQYPNTRYGNFSAGGRSLRAHRVAFEIFRAPIPDGMTVDHLCFNPTCVNPEHLRLLTAKDNAGRKNPEREAATQRKREQIRSRAAAGEPPESLAKEFGVHRYFITRICHGTVPRKKRPSAQPTEKGRTSDGATQ